MSYERLTQLGAYANRPGGAMGTFRPQAPTFTIYL